MGDFLQRTSTKKGTFGERMVRQFLVDQGVTIYEPSSDCSDKPHPIDMICIHRKKLKIFAADVKAKARRVSYPDTGIDTHHYAVYTQIQKHNNMDVFLFFVDDDLCKIYGNYLSALDVGQSVQHKGKWLSYPRLEGHIIYFPLQAMLDVAPFPEEERAKLKKLTRRSAIYDEAASAADLFRGAA